MHKFWCLVPIVSLVGCAPPAYTILIDANDKYVTPIKCNTVTGQAWVYGPDDTWRPCLERGPIPHSQYEFVIGSNAHTSVVQRIDKFTGRSWILLKNRWHEIGPNRARARTTAPAARGAGGTPRTETPGGRGK